MILHKMLRRSAFFQNLSDEQIVALSRIARSLEYRRGEYLFHEETPADSLYLIISGRVELEIQVDAGSAVAVVEVLGAGDLVGWSAIVEPYLYTSSGRCVQPTTVIAIDGPGLRDLLSRDPVLGREVYREVAHIVARRLRDTRVRLTRWLHATEEALTGEAWRSKPPGNQGA